MSTLRFGVIGVGRMAEISHLPILAEMPQVELVAFCDVDPENLEARSDEYGVARRYSDHHDMFERETLANLETLVAAVKASTADE